MNLLTHLYCILYIVPVSFCQLFFFLHEFELITDILCIGSNVSREHQDWIGLGVETSTHVHLCDSTAETRRFNQYTRTQTPVGVV